MSLRKLRSVRWIAVEIAIAIAVVFFLAPFYLVFANSFKSLSELMISTLALPSVFTWDNYVRAWDILDFPMALKNSLLITFFSNLGLTLIAAMAAYRMVRRPSHYNKALFFLFIAAMVVPFQSIMIPLVQVLRSVGIINSLQGLIFTYWGLGVSFSTFLFHGFIRSIPVEIEESAMVDGCNPYRLFFTIVLPLLKPIVASVLLLNTLWFWNDFLLPVLLLHDSDLKTIPVAMSSLFGQFLKRWDIALSAMVMSMLPAITFFAALQRQVIEGITSGGVKG